ncbi:MAG: ZIP family metal transporter [Flavobacteriaceae bacterium]|nr:ZIP family metal transporter [Flavobacteriaceae bacterium]
MVYLLPIIAVLLGYGFSLTVPNLNGKNLRLLLAFSGAFLLALTVFHLLPDIYKSYHPALGWLILVGLFLQILLEVFSKGAEHGHVHLHANSKLFPWALFVSLSLHALTEGIPINEHHGLLWGIVVHKLPVAVILSLFLLKSQLSRQGVFWFMMLFALMTPLGSLLSAYVISSHWQLYFSALVVGVFLHISTTILFETTEGHKFNAAKLLVVVVGFLLAYFI